MSSILANRVNAMLAESGLTLNDCVQNSVQSTWYVDLKIGPDTVVHYGFYNGFGYTDAPSNSIWRNALIQSLPQLYDYGFTYFLNGNNLRITSLTCTERNKGELVSLNVGINISINCNNP
jgi:hypothetical protein